MLVRLMYSSRAVEPIKQEALQAILKTSTGWNPRLGITQQRNEPPVPVMVRNPSLNMHNSHRAAFKLGQ